MIQWLSKEKLRDTVFVLWFILVSIKMSAFAIARIDLQLENQWWLLPAAAIGHFIGDKFHQRLLEMDTGIFYRLLGFALFVTSIIGLLKSLR